ncbi:hypothetical protein [Mesomycoplasma molare]|uniref:hypothetical protein n=1 Tax=Mesomycoplasma molare TaxID=171288 RepID=UPI000687496B|nr:hypothetical protein [Mesomycoplasma molare]
MKDFILGKPPIRRKYLPKVIEHLYSLFSAIIFSVNLILLIVLFIFDNNKTIADKFFNLLNKTEFRLIIAIFVFIFLANILYSIRLFIILPKTEQGHLLVYLEITFLILFVLSPFNILVSFACLKYNEIVFE